MAVLANGYADLGTWWCVTPFIGAGVGMARVTIANYTDMASVNNAGNGIGRAVTRHRVEVEFCLGAARRFGLQGHHGLTLELAYSYVNLGSGHGRSQRVRRHHHVYIRCSSTTSRRMT